QRAGLVDECDFVGPHPQVCLVQIRQGGGRWRGIGLHQYSSINSALLAKSAGTPLRISAPDFITMTRSAILSASRTFCSTIRIDMPRCCCSARMGPIRSWNSLGARPMEG